MKPDLTPVEREWGKRLASRRTGSCLEAEALIDLAERGRACEDYRARMDHILTCPTCRAHLASLRSVETLRHRSRRPGGWIGWLRPTHREPVQTRRTAPLWAVGVAALALVIVLISTFRTRLHSGPAAVVLHDVSGRIEMDSSGQLSGLPGLPADLKMSVVAALRDGSLPRSEALARLNPQGRSALRQGPFTVQGPAGTVIESSQPEFSWKLPAGAAGCKVVIASVDGTGRPFVTKMLTKEHWKPKRALESGRILAWQVIALNAAGREIARMPARPDTARFSVLAPARTAALAGIRQAAHGSHLALGVAYTQEGLLDAAEQEFATLRTANLQSEPAKRLLASVRLFRSGA